MNKYYCWTDGSLKGKVGKSSHGGWASIICDENGKIIKELYSGHRNTTNNREEIRGVLETLKYFKEPTELIITSDSQYVVNTINDGWVRKWFDNKDYTKSNLDLWFELLDYLDFHKVTMVWTKGHATNELNNRVDELCQFAANCLNLPEDEYTNNSKESGEPLVPKSETQRSDGINTGSEDRKITYSLGS